MFVRLRTRKKSFIIIGVIVVVSLLSTYGILYILTPYSGFARSVIWGDSDIKDYERFPFRTIENAPPVFHLSNLEFPDTNNANPFLSSILLDSIIPNTEGGVEDGKINFDKFLSSTGTTAFIVTKDNKIVYEKYFNGYQRDSIGTSFSIAKSITSALIGIAH
jgi:hypothetical protein